MSEILEVLSDQTLVEAQFRLGATDMQAGQVVANSADAITSINSATLTVGTKSGGIQALELPQPLGATSTPTFSELTLGALTIDSKKITSLLSGSGALDFGSTPAQSSSDLDLTVTGAAVGDFVIPIMPTPPSGCAFVCLGVTATDKVTFRLLNPSAGSVDPSSDTFSALLIRL